MLFAARQEVNLSNAAVAQVMDAFSEGLPDGQFHFDQFLAGIGDWFAGIAGLLYGFNMIRLAVDGDAMMADAQEMGQGLWDTGAYPLENPGEAVPVLFDTRTMHDNPGRWWGRLFPDLALTVAGGVGVGTKLATSLRAGAKIADELADELADVGDRLGDLGRAGARAENLTPTRADRIGSWDDVTESMSDSARNYQAQVTGAEPGTAYVVDGVRFDGAEATALLDAKGPGYARFVQDGEFRTWFEGKESLIDQAWRQVEAADGTPVQWRVAEPEAAQAIADVFTDRGPLCDCGVIARWRSEATARCCGGSRQLDPVSSPVRWWGATPPWASSRSRGSGARSWCTPAGRLGAAVYYTGYPVHLDRGYVAFDDPHVSVRSGTSSLGTCTATPPPMTRTPGGRSIRACRLAIRAAAVPLGHGPRRTGRQPQGVIPSAPTTLTGDTTSSCR